MDGYFFQVFRICQHCLYWSVEEPSPWSVSLDLYILKSMDSYEALYTELKGKDERFFMSRLSWKPSRNPLKKRSGLQEEYVFPAFTHKEGWYSYSGISYSSSGGLNRAQHTGLGQEWTAKSELFLLRKWIFPTLKKNVKNERKREKREERGERKKEFERENER